MTERKRQTNGSPELARPKEHMAANLQPDWDVLDRYFSGEASPDEVLLIERLSALNGGDEVVRSVREIWDAAGVIQTPKSPNVDDAWRHLLEKMSSDQTTVLRLRHQSRPNLRVVRNWSSTRIWPGAVAAFAAVALVAVLLNKAIDARGSHRRAVIAVAPERVFATRKAQRADIYLSDGTRVMLNVDTKLRVPADFGSRMREVTLEGEAYFDVVHDGTRPFRVRTASGTAEDAGTVFVVRSYPESKAMQVAVSNGIVYVWRDSLTAKSAKLAEGDIARVDASGAMNVVHDANVENELAWTGGRLVFDRAFLKEVIPRMARWFDADIRLGDSALAEVRYTASFRNEPVGQVLDLMAASLNARVVRQRDNSYVLHPQYVEK
jgi:transmembrane sensor